MSKQNGKELVDEQYNSQPIKKSSSWVPFKWRRLSLKQSASSSQDVLVFPPQNQREVESPKDVIVIPTQNERETIERRKAFIFPCEDTYKWSQSADEFYNNGDASFCYSRFFGDNPLDNDFWGTLLGYRSEGRLSPMVIFIWVSFGNFTGGLENGNASYLIFH